MSANPSAPVPFDPNEFFDGMWDFLGSAIIPAAAALIGIWIGAYLTSRGERQKALIDLRQSVYLESIALVYRLRNDIRNFARNAGRGAADKQADADAVRAITDALAAHDELEALDARVAVVGDPRIRDGLRVYRDATEQYFDELRKQLTTSKPRVAAADEFQAKFDGFTETYLQTLRRSMDVDELIKPESERGPMNLLRGRTESAKPRPESR